MWAVAGVRCEDEGIHNLEGPQSHSAAGCITHFPRTSRFLPGLSALPTVSSTLSHTSLPHLRRYLDPRHYQVIQHFRLLDIADYVHCMAYDAPGKHSTMAFAKQASSQGLRFAKSFSGIWNLILIGFLRRLGVLGCFV